MASLGKGAMQGSALLVNIGNAKVYLQLCENLGAGAFASVSRAVDNRGVSFAIKNILCHDIDTYESIAKEVDILLTLKHPNIVEMYGFDFINSTAVLIMEYCGQGTLNKRLYMAVDIMVQLQWMEQLASALAYLHECNIVHRDLKTENILLSKEDDLKIADFGIARHFICCKRGRLDNDPNNYISEYLDTYMGTFAGTPFWIAPEVFEHNYTEKADIFSLGVIFHAICERKYITFQGERYYGVFAKYNGQDTGIGLVMYEQQKLVDPPFCEITLKKIKHVIRYMLHFNPEKRISLVDLRSAINCAYLNVLQVEDISEVDETSGADETSDVEDTPGFDESSDADFSGGYEWANRCINDRQQKNIQVEIEPQKYPSISDNKLLNFIFFIGASLFSSVVVLVFLIPFPFIFIFMTFWLLLLILFLVVLFPFLVSISIPYIFFPSLFSCLFPGNVQPQKKNR